MASAILFFTLAALLVLVGLAGTIVPALPGTPLIFAGLVLAAWTDNFQHVGAGSITLLGFITVLSLLIDLLASILGAKRAGASKLALLGASIGTIAGIFFGLLGIFVFPFIGAAIGQYISQPDFFKAGKVGLATWLGFIFGAISKFVLALTMLGIFAAAMALRA